MDFSDPRLTRGPSLQSHSFESEGETYSVRGMTAGERAAMKAAAKDSSIDANVFLARLCCVQLAAMTEEAVSAMDGDFIDAVAELVLKLSGLLGAEKN